MKKFSLESLNVREATHTKNLRKSKERDNLKAFCGFFCLPLASTLDILLLFLSGYFRPSKKLFSGR
jgi:hypothetical protein